MQPDRWQEVVAMIESKFEVEEHEIIESDEHGGTKTEYIVFNGPAGLMKLEYIIKPRILDKKTTYSNRIGSEVKIDYVYSEKEKTFQFLAYRWSDADEAWLSMDAESLGF